MLRNYIRGYFPEKEDEVSLENIVLLLNCLEWWVLELARIKKSFIQKDCLESDTVKKHNDWKTTKISKWEICTRKCYKMTFLR